MSEPWSKADAAKAAKEWAALPFRGTDSCIPYDEMLERAFVVGTMWAAEMIEKKADSNEEIQETIAKLQGTLASRILREANRERKGR